MNDEERYLRQQIGLLNREHEKALKPYIERLARLTQYETCARWAVDVGMLGPVPDGSALLYNPTVLTALNSHGSESVPNVLRTSETTGEVSR